MSRVKKSLQNFYKLETQIRSFTFKKTYICEENYVVKMFLYMYLVWDTEMVTKICTDSGHWFLHPASNRTWSNYTRCNEHTKEGRIVCQATMQLIPNLASSVFSPNEILSAV